MNKTSLITMALAIIGVSHPVLAQDLSKPGTVFKDCDICPEMVVIPAGSFLMGSPVEETDRENMAAEGDTAAGPGEGEGRPVIRGTRPQVASWEKPLVEVTIAKPLAVSRFEITVGEYSAFIDGTARWASGGCRAYNDDGSMFETKLGLTWRDPDFEQSDRSPVVCVNWYDAFRYTEWLSFITGETYRLLSESEWEYAARAGTQTARYWGNGIDEACEYSNVGDLDMADALGWRNREFTCRDGAVFTAAVGSYKPNAFGLYDMLGNVWEWIEYCWHWNHAGHPTDGSAWTTGDCTERRINKGASWSHYPWGMRAAVRNPAGIETRYNTTGIRVAREID